MGYRHGEIPVSVEADFSNQRSKRTCPAAVREESFGGRVLEREAGAAGGLEAVLVRQASTVMTAATKRANFDLSPEQEELLANLRTQLAASGTKEAVLRAIQLTTLLLDEVQQGNRLFVGKSATTAVRLAIPELEAHSHGQWRWLVEHPHSWRRQLWVKGRKLMASAIAAIQNMT